MNPNRTVSPLWAIAGLVGLSVSACGGTSTSARAAAPSIPSTDTATLDEASVTRTTSTAVDDRPLPEPPPRVVEKTGAPETPTDAQIAELAAAIDHAELDQARLAALRAMSPKVKRFAEHVVTTRTAGIQKMDATLRGERFAPTESQRSLDLKTEARMTLGTLEDETGSQFDRAFLEAQIRGQESAADLIDRTLLPNAENERLKDDLRRQRARVGEDIESAKAVLTSLITSQP